MKSGLLPAFIAFIALTSTLFTGCLWKPTPVTTRHFVLAPISTNEPAPVSSELLTVGVGFVRMPPYLLRDAMAIRDGPSEIGYLDNALWGERLDQCFQQILAVNLSRLLRSDSIYLTDWGRHQVVVSVFVNVQQFDVDTGGNGTLIAQWRITAADTDREVKSGRAQLVQAGAAPRGRPEVIAATLSHLAAEFSRELAPPIRESVKSSRPAQDN